MQPCPLADRGLEIDRARRSADAPFAVPTLAHPIAKAAVGIEPARELALVHQTIDVSDALAEGELQLMATERPIEQLRHELGDRNGRRAGRAGRRQALLVVRKELINARAQAPKGSPCEGNTKQSSGRSRKRARELMNSASGLASGSEGHTLTFGEIPGQT